MTKEDSKKIEKSDIVHVCQICKKIIDPDEWNAYYTACEPCIDKSGRIGS